MARGTHPEQTPTGDVESAYGSSDGSRPLGVFVRFTGGPWHGVGARYVHLGGFPDMRCPGGRYEFTAAEPDGTAVDYSFFEA